jgi:hypothetical protein
VRLIGHNTGAKLVGLFLLGLVLFLPPIVKLPGGGTVLGVPALYFYLFAAWGLLIAALAWVVERRGSRGPRENG